MALETTHASPKEEDFTPLSAHEEQTPGTFFGGRPVLHIQSPGAKIKLSQADLDSQPLMTSLHNGDVSTSEDEQVVIEGIDVWVSSSHVTLFSSAQATGVQVPYPTIAVHAQEGNAVFLGLNLSDSNTADEDIVFVQLRIIPSSSTDGATTGVSGGQQQTNGDVAHSSNSAQALFKAISDCQELHPDPTEASDADFDETAPGASGWITSENMQDYMDENGEFRMPEGVTVLGGEDEEEGGALGEGAGRTRTAAEVDGVDGEEDDSKWQRTG